MKPRQIILLSTLLVFFAFNVQAIKQQFYLLPDTSNVKLALVGMAKNADNQAIYNAQIQLFDVMHQLQQTYHTDLDGRFYFHLQADAEYFIKLVDYGNEIIDSQRINTHGIEQAGIISIDLYDSESQLHLVKQENDALDVYASPTLTEEREMSHVITIDYDLYFKIQLVLLKATNINIKPNETYREIGNISFSDKMIGEVKTETTPNGEVRIVTGHFYQLQDAIIYQQELIKYGYPEASVLPYYKEEVLAMSPQKAAQLYGY